MPGWPASGLDGNRPVGSVVVLRTVPRSDTRCSPPYVREGHIRNDETLRNTILLGLVVGLAVASLAALQAQSPQAQQPPATSPGGNACDAPGRSTSGSTPPPPINQSDDPPAQDVQVANIGPAAVGGRMMTLRSSDHVDLLHRLRNRRHLQDGQQRTTFTPIFDTYPVSSIGDIALAPSDPTLFTSGPEKEQPPERVVWRRDLQVDRRREKPSPTSVSKKHSRSRGSWFIQPIEHRLCRGHWASVRTEQGTWPLQDR